MSAPFFKYDAFGVEVSLVWAFVIGIAFGFVLERAGFGSALKLAAQFYFKELRVLKVMFTAIITAMVGVYFLSVLGFLDLSLIYLTPTFLLPQVVGGILLGIGFVIGGYCPGTSVVSAGTGRIDGMVYILGIFGGLLMYAEVYPMIADWTRSTAMGQVTLSEYFKIDYGVLVFAVVVMAVVAFLAAELAERKIGGLEADRGMLSCALKQLTPARSLMLALLGLGFLALFGGNPYRGGKVMVDTQELATIVDSKVDHIQAEDLASRIMAGNIDYVLLDIRDEEAYRKYHIPTAIHLPMTSPEFQNLPRNETIILYSDGGIHSAQAWFLLKARGYPAVYMVFEGLNAWMDDVLYPAKPKDPSREAQEAFAKRAAMAKFFGGKAVDAGEESVRGNDLPDAPPPPPPVSLPSGGKRKAREGC